jgi:UDP-GlcNAc:undecaprenyl-phosphate/decaprenyl-phosphate GlcNAc-1-phosphate transferase
MFKISYLVIFFSSIFIIYFLTKYSKLIGEYFHVIDIPNQNKIHISATPLIGSFGIIIFSIIIIFVFGINNFNNSITVILAYSYIFFLLGYIDDRVNINAYLKLLISIIILFVALYFTEIFLIKKIYIELLNKDIYLGKLSILFSILCISLLINSLNLMDGINGLASGFSTLWLLSLSLLLDGDIKIILLFISFFMAINTYQIIKGKYFLGDSGTLFLGCLIALVTIFTYNTLLNQNITMSIEKIFIFFMIPGLDMFRLFIFRLIKKKDPFSRDLSHLHHYMIKQFSLNQTLMIYLFLFSSTNFLSFLNIINSIAIILIYSVIYIFFIYFSKKKILQ